MVSGIDSFPLLAVPFFILAGNLMNNAGITNRIYNFALALVGWLKGGLGHVNVLGSVIFAGMSGTAIADAAGLGTIEIKAMKDHGYSTEFAVGVTAASATLGPDHPAVAAVRDLRDDGQRLGGRAVPRRHPARRADGGADDAHRRLLRAQEQLGRRRQVRVARALVKALGETRRGDRLAAAAVAAGRRRPARRRSSRSSPAWSSLFARTGCSASRRVLPIMTPVLLIGGMTTGLFTPTEGAIAACVWAMVLGFVWYRTLTLEDVRQGVPGHRRDDVHGAVHRRGGIDLRLDAHGHRRHRRRSPNGCSASPTSAWVFLLLANLLMLFVGCFLEPTAAITILVPILMPIASSWASTRCTSAW